jgi:magnesium chelatase family protein
MDRIDMHLEVPAVAYKDLAERHAGASSADMLARAEQAREIQQKRFGNSGIHTNARMNSRQIEQHCSIDGF